MAGGDVLWIRTACHAYFTASDALCGAVSLLRLRIIAIKLPRLTSPLSASTLSKTPRTLERHVPATDGHPRSQITRGQLHFYQRHSDRGRQAASPARTGVHPAYGPLDR